MSNSSSRSATFKIVACPRCGANVEWGPQSKYRPFCSERCKMIDLGAWASEAYRIPVEEDKDTPETDEKRED